MAACAAHPSPTPPFPLCLPNPAPLFHRHASLKRRRTCRRHSNIRQQSRSVPCKEPASPGFRRRVEARKGRRCIIGCKFEGMDVDSSHVSPSSTRNSTFKKIESGHRILEPEEVRVTINHNVESYIDINHHESRPRLNIQRNWRFFGVSISPDIAAISMVYFVQGILGLSRLAVSFFLKDDLQLDPAESSIISGVAAIPWLIKPLYGFISDGLPLFGYRRRSYLILCGLLGAVSWTMMATFVNDKYGAMIAIFLSSLSVAFSDVVVDSMAVERARGESQATSGSIQSLCWGSSAAGGIVSAYFSGSLVETYGVRFVFAVTAFLPLMTSAVARLVSEELTTFSSFLSNKDEAVCLLSDKSSTLESTKLQVTYLWRTIKEPAILLPTLFIFVWQTMPTSDTAMFFFTTNKLNFGPEFLGRVKLVTSVASLAGVGIYNGILKNVSLKKTFFWTTVIGSCLSLTQVLLVTGANQKLGISNEWFAMGDTLILTVLGQISFMPVLVLAAKLCPPGVEATLFATLMSISNGGSVVSGLLGAGLTRLFGVTSHNFDNLALLVVVCNVSSLFSLPLLRFIPSESQMESTLDKAEKASGSMENLKRN